MKTGKTTIVIAILVIVAFVGLLATACDLTEDEVVATVDSMSSSELAGLSATIEALPPAQVAALETAAAAYGVPPLTDEQEQAIIATVDAARATATKVAEQASQGERVNATEAPNIAPVIVYFFASAPNQAQAQSGIRYLLNWTTENANRVEIFGHVMDNPQQGSWAVYSESDNWTLWTANDKVWVESSMLVQPDKDTGSTLQNISVNSRNITLSYRDPQFVDGDQMSVDINGVRVLDGYVSTGRHVAFPVVLQPGANTVTITAQNAGVTPPLIVEVTASNVTVGPATQLSRGLNNGESQSFTITAP
jgi:hypothetical protein